MREFPKQVDLRILGIVAMFLLTAFVFYKNFASQSTIAEMILAKKNSVIPCGTDGSASINYSYSKTKNGKFNRHSESNNDSRSQNNGSGCSHQSGITAICDITGSKRKPVKNPSC